MRLIPLGLACAAAFFLASPAQAAWFESGQLAGGVGCCTAGATASSATGATIGAVVSTTGVRAIVRDANGTVSAPGDPLIPGGTSDVLAVGIDAAGTAVVIGQNDLGDVMATSRPAGGTFSMPETLGDGAGASSAAGTGQVRIVDVNRTGEAIAYVSESSGQPLVRVRSGGSWGGLETVPFSPDTAVLGVLMGADGTAYVFAVRTTLPVDANDLGTQDLLVYRRPAGGGWDGGSALAATVPATNTDGFLRTFRLVSARAGTGAAVAWASQFDAAFGDLGVALVKDSSVIDEGAPSGAARPTAVAADATGKVSLVAEPSGVAGDASLYEGTSGSWSTATLPNPPVAVASDDAGDRVISLKYTDANFYVPAGAAMPSDAQPFAQPGVIAASLDGSIDVATAGRASFVGTNPDNTVVHLAQWDGTNTNTSNNPPPPPPPPSGCTITGTDASETLRGTAGDDVICALGGDDILLGLGGNDVLRGGAGNDRLYGDEGADHLDGGPGNDVFNAGTGDDVVEGGAGNDRMDGKAGKDVVHGGAGGDVVIGGYDNDQLFGDDGTDLLQDGAGTNAFDGGAGNDWIYARQSHKETVNCGAGTDHYQVDTRRPDRKRGCEREIPLLEPVHVLSSEPVGQAADNKVVNWARSVPAYWKHNNKSITWAGIIARSCYSDVSAPLHLQPGYTFGGFGATLWASVRDQNVYRKKWVRFEWKVQVWAQQGFTLNAPSSWHDVGDKDDSLKKTSGRSKGFHPRWKGGVYLPFHDETQPYRLLVRFTWYHDVFGPDQIAQSSWVQLAQCMSNDGVIHQ